MTASESPPAGHIVLTSEDDIATLTLHRPDKFNAIGPDMLAELDRLMAEIDVDPDVRVVIVTGSGERAFSVGADVNAWTALEPLDMWRRWIREGHRVLQRLEQPAAADHRRDQWVRVRRWAGASACRRHPPCRRFGDIRAARDEDRHAARMGGNDATPAGDRRRPFQTVDLLGMPYRRRHCRALGVWSTRSSPPGTLMERCRALASEIAANAPISVQLAKAAINGDARRRKRWRGHWRPHGGRPRGRCRVSCKAPAALYGPVNSACATSDEEVIGDAISIRPPRSRPGPLRRSSSRRLQVRR